MVNNYDKKRGPYNDNCTITISREFHDLTHLISQDMPVYPGDPK
jgi:hypothetical protein